MEQAPMERAQEKVGNLEIVKKEPIRITLKNLVKDWG
jgi:hypothetical protein